MRSFFGPSTIPTVDGCREMHKMVETSPRFKSTGNQACIMFSFQMKWFVLIALGCLALNAFASPIVSKSEKDAAEKQTDLSNLETGECTRLKPKE